MASLVALLTLTSALVALMGARPAAAASLKPTITKDVDANSDAVFSNTENVPKTVTYPWTVTYRLTIFGGTARDSGASTRSSASRIARRAT